MRETNTADRLAAASASWDDFFTAVAELPGDTEKGKAFERLTELYLKTKPEYATKLANVWRVGGPLPRGIRKKLRLPNRDEGIDLIAETKDGHYWAIQCKFRSDTDKALTYRELSTFTSLAFHSCQGIAEAVVAHTCAKPVKKRALLPQTTEIGLERWLQTTPEDWKRIHALLGGRPQRPEPRKPRPHQKKAVAAATAHFVKDTAKRGRLIMPCGTGKSLTAFWIANALKARRIIVAVPSLALIKQSLEDWTREFVAQSETPPPDWLCVCSDESVGNVERDDFVSGVYDLGIPATTDENEIAEFLSQRTRGRKIVFVTYQSSAKLAAGVKKAQVVFDLAILDEAHKTVGEQSKAFATLLFDRNVPVKQRIFMTATERVYRGSSDDVLSMDDESRYGERFYQLTFKEAIDAGIIADYKILTVTVTDEQIESLIRENRLITGKKGEIEEQEAQALAAGIALARAVKRRGIKHAISFHRSIRSAQEFADRQTALVEAGYLRPRVTPLHISSKKTAGQRAQLLDEFKSETRALMTNARCLTEGVDVPAIDCVLFADPKQSVIDIVQAAGRALRPYEGKPYGYIMLPLVIPSGIDFEAFAETTAFRQVARVVTALSTQDERIAVEFRTRAAGERASGRIVEIEGDVSVGMKLDLSDFIRRIESRVWQRVGRANWRSFEEARAYVHSLRLTNQSDWVRVRRDSAFPPDIPTNPNREYRDHGWISLGDWLGTGRPATKDAEFWPFDKARSFAHGLGLRNEHEWRKYAKSGERPFELPSSPPHQYRGKGWISWPDWLGTRTTRKGETYRDFASARTYVRSLGLRNHEEWRAFSKSAERPNDIPGTPEVIYRKQGWKGLGDWLGTDRVANRNRQFRSFVEARNFVRAIGLRRKEEWQAYCRSGNKPPDIPSNPQEQYKEEGWRNLGDWLGTGSIATKDRQFRQFEEARSFVRSLGLRSQREWFVYRRSGQCPGDIPSNPQTTYLDEGWISWPDWLGTKAKSQKQGFRPFAVARAFVRSLRLHTVTEWRRWAASEKRPTDIPADPARHYAGEGWVDMTDWLGAPVTATRALQFRSFIQARAYVQRLKLRDQKAWRDWCRSGQRPFDIPTNPHRTYRQQGWRGYRDWLGNC